MSKLKIKSGDIVLFAEEFFTVEWIDDSGVSNLVGLRSSDKTIKVVSFSERIILKVEEET
jgi:hypothetical protein